MASLELCPISEHLEENEVEELYAGLEEAEIKLGELDDDVEPIPLEQDFDDDVFIDFWDQLEANDVACDAYLPFDFEEIVEIGERRFGSAHALVTVLASLKEDMQIEDDDSDDGNDEAIEDIDDELDEFDDYGSEDEQYEDDDASPIEVKDQQLRRVWRAMNRGARLAASEGLVLFVHS